MEKTPKFDSIQPRFLRYRGHYKIYLISLLSISAFILFFWGHRLSVDGWMMAYVDYTAEFWVSCLYFAAFTLFYLLWLRHRLNHSVQVHEDRLTLHHGKRSEELRFEDIESVGVVVRSIFYCKLKSGVKYYFNCGLERVDYIWEGLHAVRPDLFAGVDYEGFRTKLVQYDHHQKRKEWFFRHKIVDIFNWVVLPVLFLSFSFLVQSRAVVINQHGLYFFRLFMYSLLILMFTTFLYSMVLKKFIFDKRIKLQMHAQPDDKARDLDFESIVLHRSKIMQMVTACFIFALVIMSEVNLLSVTKSKGEVVDFNLKKGQTLIVDNRYNCVACRYPVQDGDIVLFGRGTMGQIMAREGDMVGQVSQDRVGRTIASENVQEIPRGYVAVKLPNSADIVLVKVDDLIGRIQK